MSMDCSAGVVDIFKWVERLWVAADRDWKLLGLVPVPNLQNLTPATQQPGASVPDTSRTPGAVGPNR